MSASLIRSRTMVTHVIDRHRWNEITDGAVLQEDATIVEIGIYPLCCTDQQPGAVTPRSDILREANVHRPPKLEHAVQRGDSNGHLGHLPASGP